MQTYGNDGMQLCNRKTFGQTVLQRAFLDAEDGIERVGQKRVDNRLFAAIFLDVVFVLHVHFLTPIYALNR